MTNEVVNLGTLACTAELEAVRHPAGSGARIHLLDLANRYREAQYQLLAADEYSFADVLEEEGVQLAPTERPFFSNVLQLVFWYFAILAFCLAAVVTVHHIWF